MCVYVHPFPCPQNTTVETHLLPCMDPEGELWQQLVSEHIATFVVNTLFIAIAGVTDVSVTMVPKKMTDWFKTYRYSSSIHTHSTIYTQTPTHSTCTPPPTHTHLHCIHTYTTYVCANRITNTQLTYIHTHAQRFDDTISEAECV